MTIDQRRIKRILVIKLRAIGDVLLSTIVLRNIRLAFPDAKLDFLTEPPSKGIVERLSDVNKVILHDRSHMSGLTLIRAIRSQQYDLILDLFGNPRSALIARLSGAKYRVGYRFRGRGYAYNILVEPRGSQVHNTQFNLDAIEALGIAIQDRNIYFPIAHEDTVYVDQFLREARLDKQFLVALGTNGGWYTKRWGLKEFAMLGDTLIEKHEAQVVLIWGPGEKEEVEQVKAMMKHSAFIPPATNLSQLGGLLQRCSLMVSNDSGPMHIAAAVGTPVLGIYGPTNPVLQGPYGNKHVVIRRESLDCLGCNLTKCPIGHPCMEELSVDHVLEAVEKLIRKNNLAA